MSLFEVPGAAHVKVIEDRVRLVWEAGGEPAGPLRASPWKRGAKARLQRGSGKELRWK